MKEITNEVYDGIGEVYNTVTDGIYKNAEDPADAVIEEFNSRYGDLGKLAYELQDKLDELFSDCATIDDCKDVLEDYFCWYDM